MTRNTGELVLAAGVLALGVALAIGAWLLPENAGYARVSARFFPGLVAAALIATGALLLREAALGGFRALADEPRGRFSLRGFGWVSAGVIAHMALIAGIGFTLAGAVLYAATARGFGSARPLRDLGVGVVMAAVVFVLFTRVLTLSLPWGAWIPGALP